MASDIPPFLYHPMLVCTFTIFGYMNHKVPKVYVDTFLKPLTRKNCGPEILSLLEHTHRYEDKFD
jgi:hypothetical protein